MVVGLLRILAAVCASGTAYRVDHKALQRAVAVAHTKAQTVEAETGGVDALKASALASRLVDSILLSGVSRLGVPDKTDDAPKDFDWEDLLKSVVDLPFLEPFWPQVVANIRSLLAIMMSSQPLFQNCINKEYEKFSDHVCYHLPSDMKMLKEQESNTSRPMTAYYCGNPDINWSGDEFQGKPQNVLCNATVGSAYEPGGVCAKYSDKELVLNLISNTVSSLTKGAPMESGDPRTINTGLADCIMGLQDCNIYMCHHCPGRCSD